MSKNLNRWLSKNLISKEEYEMLQKEEKEYKNKIFKTNLQVTLYTIGAILLCGGVYFLIQANEWLLNFVKFIGNLFTADFVKLSIISIILFISLYFGYDLKYKKEKFPKLGNCLIFFSSILFGYFYMLIFKTVIIEPNNWIIQLLWLSTILPFAYKLKNNGINILSTILFCWFFISSLSDVLINFNAVIVLLGCLLLVISNFVKIKKEFFNFSKTYKFFANLILFFSLVNFALSPYKVESDKLNFFIYYGLIFVIAILNILNLVKVKKNYRSLNLYFETYNIFLILLYLISLIILNESLSCFFANILTIILIVSLFYFGNKLPDKNSVKQAICYFTIYLICNYLQYLDEYLKGATYFILAGLILVSIGFYIERKQKK